MSFFSEFKIYFSHLSNYIWVGGLEVFMMVAFGMKFMPECVPLRSKVNVRSTCMCPSPCPIMLLHSMRDRCRCSRPVSQSLMRPPMSTVTTPPLPHSASSASVSEIVDSHEVYGERDSELKKKPQYSVNRYPCNEADLGSLKWSSRIPSVSTWKDKIRQIHP